MRRVIITLVLIGAVILSGEQIKKHRLGIGATLPIKKTNTQGQVNSTLKNEQEQIRVKQQGLEQKQEDLKTRVNKIDSPVKSK